MMSGLRAISARAETHSGLTAQARVIDQAAVQNQLNAMTIIDLFGAVEGYVEALSKVMRRPVVDYRRQVDKQLHRRICQIIRQHSRSAYEAGTAISEVSHALKKAVHSVIDKRRPGLPVESFIKGLAAAARWEDALHRFGLGETTIRPLPGDLRNTLNELGEIRNILLHRMGRIDQRALDSVTEGPWKNVGQEVIIDPSLYRRYVAALWSFPDEVVDRLIIQIGGSPRFDINSWRDNVPAGG